jgi:hypothetical protein
VGAFGCPPRGRKFAEDFSPIDVEIAVIYRRALAFSRLLCPECCAGKFFNLLYGRRIVFGPLLRIPQGAELAGSVRITNPRNKRMCCSREK